jgi:hypothetical protein
VKPLRGLLGLSVCALLRCQGPELDLGGGTNKVADAAADTDTTIHASCAELHSAAPTLTTGLYPISWEGVVKPTYCDMDMLGGGWTAFFVGLVGHDLVFGHFEDDPTLLDYCPDPSNRCLRRIPTAINETSQFAASCADDAIVFHVPKAVISYFATGKEQAWQFLSDVDVGAGSPNLNGATQIWTGMADGNNRGWIISANDHQPLATSLTFASSYDYAKTWDFCNNNAGHGKVTRLMFR